MHKTPKEIKAQPSMRAAAALAIISTCISVIGLGLWLWMNTQRGELPALGTKASKRFLREYLATAHDTFLIVLALAAIALIGLLWRAQHREHSSELAGKLKLHEKFLQFAKEQPLTLALFVAYTIAMVQGTSWLYPELVGWTSDVMRGELINNFRLHDGFISETMRRNDFRFFPLAHQDLHILSWFTPYVKIWMLFSSAELIAIVILSARFIRRMCNIDIKKGPEITLIIALLLMLHPATAEGFFQLIFSERLLTLLLIGYAVSYQHYQCTKKISSLYTTLLAGLIGIFVKDIAILLFTLPPLTTLILGSLGLIESYPQWSLDNPQPFSSWSKSYRLELCVLALIPIFAASYIFLSLLPSSYANSGSYSKDSSIYFIADWRWWALASFAGLRTLSSLTGKIKLQLLDTFNIGALAYTAALATLVGFRSTSYLALPVQLITVLNITWIWSAWLAPSLNKKLSWRTTACIGAGMALMIAGSESIQKHSFGKTVESIKTSQSSWLETYLKIIEVANKLKQNGEAVNIIYSEKSWLSHKRHLNRIQHDRLIQHDPNTGTYQIKSGAQSGSNYIPKEGDLILNIDKNLDTLTQILSTMPHQLIYRHNGDDLSGAIYRFSQK